MEQKHQVMNWLKSMGVISWVRFDITDIKEVELAADWFIDQMDKFNNFLLQQEADSDYVSWVEADENGSYLTDSHTKAYPCDHTECDLRFINHSRTICSGHCRGEESQPRFVAINDVNEDVSTMVEAGYEDYTPDAFGD